MPIDARKWSTVVAPRKDTAVSVMVVDHQSIPRTGCSRTLSQKPNITVVAEACDAEHALAVGRHTRPLVTIVDTSLPDLQGRTHTRDFVRALVSLPSRVIVFTGVEDDRLLLEVLRAGARAYLLKSATGNQLVEAIDEVLAGNCVIAPAMTRRLVENFHIHLPRRPESDSPFAGLSAREQDVLFGIARGWSNSDIAQHLGVAETTVKTHVSRVLSKLGLRSRVEAALLARQETTLG